jgi:hypothetical protein
MDRTQWVDWRKRKYMAEVLELFEERIAPHLSGDAAGDEQDFKAFVRRRFGALAADASLVLGLEDEAVNRLAQEMKDNVGIR